MSSTALSLCCTAPVWERFGAQIRAISPNVRPLLVGVGSPVDPDEIDIACFSVDLWTGALAEFVATCGAATSLRWLHSSTAGVDHPLFRRLLGRGVRVTTSSGAAARPIAQSAMMLILALSRDLPGWTHAQAAHRWQPRQFIDLDGQVLGVVGFGPIGRELAALAEAFGMTVEVCRRHPDPTDRWPTVTSIGELAPRVDWLALAAPLTPDTRHMLDKAVLATMRPSAQVINVGRGALIDDDALIDALRQGRLAGAGLDVFAMEPLPAEHPLWDLPNVIVTPHSSGNSPGYERRTVEIFLDNLSRFVAGEPMLNVVAAPAGA